MRTRFTPEQLADPELQVAADQLRKCVHCGFCIATCPTYVTTGNELDSPRGRIVLMQEMLEGQVAVLSSGLPDAEEALAILNGLFASDFYRADEGRSGSSPAPRRGGC